MKKVYLVNQHKSSSEIYNETIYVFEDIKEATEAVKRLNLEYAAGVLLDEAGEFVSIDNEYDYHYYTIESSAVETSADDAEIYNPATEKDNEQSDLFVIACYDKEDNSKFLGFVCKDKFTYNKDEATLYNENIVETVSYHLVDELEVMTEFFHITKADDAK